MTTNKCKIELPNQLPESGVTRVQFKTWKDAMMIYLRQNEDFLHFFQDGMYSNWVSAEENPKRILVLSPDDHPVANTGENQGDLDSKRLLRRQKDLSTMLSIIGRKVDQYDHDDVVNGSTDLQSIWYMIELVYDIGRKGVHFLELEKLKFEKGDSPVKFYKKIYHHVLDNLYKKDDNLKYKGYKLESDEKISPTLLNFMLYFTIQSIDPRLMKKIKDKWGHLLDKDTCLFDLKDTILKAIPDLLNRLDTKEFEANSVSQLSALFPRGGQRGYGRGGGGSSRQNRGRGRSLATRMFCRVCFAARSPRHIYTSHNVANCSRWTKKDVEDLRVMMCEMKVDPDLYPDSGSDTEQDHE